MLQLQDKMQKHLMSQLFLTVPQRHSCLPTIPTIGETPHPNPWLPLCTISGRNGKASCTIVRTNLHCGSFCKRIICIAASFVRELRKIPVLNFLLELLELICPLSAVRQYIFTRNREGSDEQILWKQIRCKSNYLTSDKTYDGGAVERSCERKSVAKMFSNDYKVFQLELAFW